MSKLLWRSDTEPAVRTAMQEHADGLYANARAMEERAGIINWLGRAFQVELPGMVQGIRARGTMHPCGSPWWKAWHGARRIH